MSLGFAFKCGFETLGGFLGHSLPVFTSGIFFNSRKMYGFDFDQIIGLQGQNWKTPEKEKKEKRK